MVEHSTSTVMMNQATHCHLKYSNSLGAKNLFVATATHCHDSEASSWSGALAINHIAAILLHSIVPLH
jgi:hypothetical protein